LVSSGFLKTLKTTTKEGQEGWGTWERGGKGRKEADVLRYI